MTYITVPTLFVFTLIVTAMSAFIEEPIDQNVSVGQEAVFRCQHSSADTIRWKVNGSLISSSNRPDGARFDADDPVFILTITGRLDYNGTVVQCVARFDSGAPEQVSNPAALLIVEVNALTSTAPPTTVSTTTVHTTMPPTTSAPLEGFTEGPYSMNVTAGKQVDFRCVHHSFDVEWEVNGSMLGGGHFPPGVSVAKHALSGGGFHHVLRVHASRDHDNTSFACVLEDYPSIRSEVAVLRVQGPLDAPSDVNSSRDYTTNTTTISWTPPHSIDLTNVEPDIVYCIEVENITCGERGGVIVSECGITEPTYQSRDIPLNYIYNITVTPMSNVVGALNGTPAHLEERFPTLSQVTSVSPRDNGKVNVLVTMDITDHRSKPLPRNCSLSLARMNTNNQTLSAANETRRGDSIVLDLDGGLKVGELLDCIVVAYTCDNHPLTPESLLSTHLVQDISFPTPTPGAITVTGDFLNSSATTGLLVIAYTSSSNVRYHLYSRTPNEQDFRTVINNLEGGEYHASVFTVENGLPSKGVATLPQRVSVTSTERLETPPIIEYEIESTSTSVCITCTFLESSTATDCVAVVHQRISQLGLSGTLMNIESSHKFTRSGDTASGCIEGVNLDDYQIGVMGGRLLTPAPGLGVCSGCVAGSVLAVILFVVSAVVSIMIFYGIHIFLRKKSGDRSRPMDEESSSRERKDNHYAIVSHQDEIKQENTPLVRRVRADSSGSGTSQLQPTSLDAQLEESSFTAFPVTPHRAGDDIGLTGAVPESAYAEPAFLVSPRVPIPPVTERSAYTNVEKFQNPEGLNYALLEHVSQRQHNPRPDDRYTGQSEYAEVLVKKDECSNTKEAECARKVSPKSALPPAPTRCDIESVGDLLYPISPKWEKFAKALLRDEDADDVIENVIASNETDEARLQEMVERYFDNGDFKHNWEEVVSILRGVDEQLADKIHDLHVYPYKAPLPGQTQGAEDSHTPADSQSGMQMKHEKEEAKKQLTGSSQCEDGDIAASCSADEGLEDTELEQTTEGEDIVTPEQESVAVSMEEVAHPISQDCGSLELQTDTSDSQELILNQTELKRSISKPTSAYSSSRQYSDNSDSGLVSDDIPMNNASEEDHSYVHGYDGAEACFLVGPGVMQPSGQGDSDEPKYYVFEHKTPNHGDDGHSNISSIVVAPCRVGFSLTPVLTDDLASSLFSFPDASNGVPCTRDVAQEMCSETEVDMSKHTFIQQLRQAQASKACQQEEWQSIARQTYEVNGDTEDVSEASSLETILCNKRLRVKECQKKRCHQFPIQRKTVF